MPEYALPWAVHLLATSTAGSSEAKALLKNKVHFFIFLKLTFLNLFEMVFNSRIIIVAVAVIYHRCRVVLRFLWQACFLLRVMISHSLSKFEFFKMFF